MSDRIHLAPSSRVTFEGAEFVGLSFLSQIAVAALNAMESPSYRRNIDMHEVMLTHADVDPGGADEAFGAGFPVRCTPAIRRTRTEFGVDAYRR